MAPGHDKPLTPKSVDSNPPTRQKNEEKPLRRIIHSSLTSPTPISTRTMCRDVHSSLAIGYGQSQRGSPYTTISRTMSMPASPLDNVPPQFLRSIPRFSTKTDSSSPDLSYEEVTSTRISQDEEGLVKCKIAANGKERTSKEPRRKVREGIHNLWVDQTNKFKTVSKAFKKSPSSFLTRRHIQKENVAPIQSTTQSSSYSSVPLLDLRRNDVQLLEAAVATPTGQRHSQESSTRTIIPPRSEESRNTSVVSTANTSSVTLGTECASSRKEGSISRIQAQEVAAMVRQSLHEYSQEARSQNNISNAPRASRPRLKHFHSTPARTGVYGRPTSISFNSAHDQLLHGRKSFVQSKGPQSRSESLNSISQLRSEVFGNRRPGYRQRPSSSGTSMRRRSFGSLARASLTDSRSITTAQTSPPKTTQPRRTQLHTDLLGNHEATYWFPPDTVGFVTSDHPKAPTCGDNASIQILRNGNNNAPGKKIGVFHPAFVIDNWKTVEPIRQCACPRLHVKLIPRSESVESMWSTIAQTFQEDDEVKELLFEEDEEVVDEHCFPTISGAGLQEKYRTIKVEGKRLWERTYVNLAKAWIPVPASDEVELN